MGYKPGYKHDATFWDKAVELPGCYIIEREITKAVNGESYFTNDEETGKPQHHPAVDFSVFHYYYTLWENFHYFGYPNRMDWTDDRNEWFNRMLKFFENAYTATQNFLDAKAMKSAHNKGA